MHVDDLKVSHKSELEITKFIVYLGKLYGNKITVNQGEVHDYLGMDLDYSEKSKGIVKVSMINYVEKILQDFPEEINSTSSPAADHLFQVREELKAKTLPEEQAEQYHHSVAQLLFLSTRARKDIQKLWHFSQQGQKP